MRTLVLSSSSQKEQCGLPAECTCRHPTHNTRRERQRSVTPKAATTPGRFPRRISRNKSQAVANLARVARLVPAAEVIHALVAIGGASDRPTPGSPPARACGVWPHHCRAKNTEKSSHNSQTHIRRNTDEKGKNGRKNGTAPPPSRTCTRAQPRVAGCPSGVSRHQTSGARVSQACEDFLNHTDCCRTQLLLLEAGPVLSLRRGVEDTGSGSMPT